MNHLVCLGMGFSATALAELVAPEGWKISGTSRNPEGAADISARGWHGVVFDAERDGEALRAEFAGGLSDATHLVISIPPGDAGDAILKHHAEDIAQLKKLEWVGYLSTIGVYGDHQGDWVDETTPATPLSKRSKLRLEAETSWQAFAKDKNWRLQIFRLAGIYGPGRSAIDQIEVGKARRIIKKDQVFNRIHVGDIATILRAGMAGAGQHTVYNVADDEPGPPQDVVAFAAHLLGVEPPPEVAFEDAELSAMGRSFYNERKRVRNERIKTDLGISLSYPNYRDGLQVIMKEAIDLNTPAQGATPGYFGDARPVTGVLLAGGQSRRMGGGDKGLLELAGKPMLAHVLSRLQPQVDRVIINANGDAARFDAFGLPVFADTIEGHAGPLAGVLAGMRWSAANVADDGYIVTVSTDAPLIPIDLVNRLAGGLRDNPEAAIALASSGGNMHPVIGLWPVTLADDLDSALREGVRKVRRWTDRHGTVIVDFAYVQAGNREIDPFFNANTPDELEEARAILGEL